MTEQNQQANDRSRSLNKFYASVSKHLEDLGNQFEDYPEVVTESIPDQIERNLYGKIDESEFREILEAYTVQQQDPDLANKPISCDKVAGGNFSGLLHSRIGFHHLGAGEILAKILNIKDTDRISFLSGSSSFKASKNETLEGLRDTYNKDIIKKIVQKANDYMNEQKSELAKTEIERALRIDPTNTDVLIAKGSYEIKKGLHADAIRTLKKCLENCDDDQSQAKTLLADALFEQGVTFFHKKDYSLALNLFLECLGFNPNHQGSLLHKSMCEGKMMQRVPKATNQSSYRG